MNAKQEFLDAVKGTARIKCASIFYEKWGDKGIQKTLKVNYSEEEYNEFLNSLDFNYDSGYGTQELYGTVWLEDGTWLSRDEYDGSERWKYNYSPAIPVECL